MSFFNRCTCTLCLSWPNVLLLFRFLVQFLSQKAFLLSTLLSYIYNFFFFLLNPSNVRVTGNGSRSFTSRVCLYVCSFLPEAALLCFLMRSGDHPPLSDLRETIHYQEKVYLYYCIVNGNDMLIVNGTMGTVGSLTRTHTQTHILGCISHMLTCTHTVWFPKACKGGRYHVFLMAVIIIIAGVLLVRSFFYCFKIWKGI